MNTNRARFVIVICLFAATGCSVQPSRSSSDNYYSRQQSRNEDRRDSYRYRGYTGDRWEKDYGVYSGRCNTTRSAN